jgi:hypothetical protein
LQNNKKAIQNGDIAEIKSVVYLLYQELDEFVKMVYVRGLDSIEVKTGLFAGSTTYLFTFFWH